MFVAIKSKFEMYGMVCERVKDNYGEQQEEGLMFLRSAGSRAQFFPRRGARCEQHGRVGGCFIASGEKDAGNPG